MLQYLVRHTSLFVVDMLSLVFAVVTKVLLYFLVLLTGAWCWFQYTHWNLLRAAAKIPTPSYALPIIGHASYARSIMGYDKVAKIVMDFLSSAVSKNLKICCFWCGPLPLIMVVDAEIIQKILNSSSTSEKASEYDYLKVFLKDGLVTAPWKVWKVTRRYINPLFHPRNLEHMVPTFNRNSEELVKVLSAHVSGAPVDVFEDTMDMALKNFSNFAFLKDIEFNTQSEEFKGMRHVIEHLPYLAFQRVVLVWLRVYGVLNICKKTEFLNDMFKSWETFTDHTFKRASLKQLENNDKHKADEADSDEVNFLDVYRTLQTNFPSFSEADMKAELLTLFATGSDTVSLTVASCLLALAQYQNIQDKLIEEILSVVGKDDDLTTQDLSRMPYLDQVYKETLRFFTVVPFIGRKTTEDIVLDSFYIPAGATLVLALAGINKNPKLFPRPNDFDPDHFSPDNETSQWKMDFIPFGAGPRNCIGKRYAEILGKFMIIKVLRQFKLSTKMNIHNLKMKIAISLMCTEGYNIRLENRH